MPAYPTFPEPRGLKYHRVQTLSLLCSEWEEVDHAWIKHRQMRNKKFRCGAGRNACPAPNFILVLGEGVEHVKLNHQETSIYNGAGRAHGKRWRTHG